MLNALCCRHRRAIIKTLLIMKFTAIILLSACLGASATGFTQQVSLNEKNSAITDVFKSIRQQTGYLFVYDLDMIKEAKKVTVYLNNASLEEALKACFKDQPFSYEIVNKTIVVKQKLTSLKEEKEEANLPPPPIDISGRVVNENGEPVAGVSVLVKGTNNGASTNANGEFVLTNVDENAILSFSSTNIEPFEIKISGRKEFNFSAKTKVSSLNEVVINKGYYSEKQRYSVSNVGRITAKDIEKQPVNNPLLALQGRVPGLLITQTNGIAGGSIKVRIQGQNSIAKGNEPLYVIDGVPYISEVLSTTNVGNSILGNSNTNPLAYINTADIESIDVLKDADATAIYGSRAANGAILITTKKGKPGDARINIDIQTGWGKVAHHLDMMNTSQYLAMRREAFKNDNVSIPSIITDPNDGNYDINGLWDTTRYTNWQKELIGGTASVTKLSASVSGGAANVQYLVSGTYQRETTVFPGDFANKTGGMHFNLNSTSSNHRFKIQFSGNYFFGINLLPKGDLTSTAVGLAPNAPALRDSTGNLNWAPNTLGTSSWSFGHPLSILYQLYETKTKNLISNAVLSYQLIPGLELRSNFGYTNLETKEFNANMISAEKPEDRPNFLRGAEYSNGSISSWIIEPQLNYQKSIASGKLDILIGATAYQRKNDGQRFLGIGYPTDEAMADMRSAANFYVTGNVTSVYKYIAGFTRVNYNLKNKYIINLTARRDGSSRFGSKNQFHNFAAAGLGWIFSEEKLVKKYLSFLSYGKLRGSYGTVGSDQIGDYAFLSTYSSSNGFGINPYQGVSSIQSNGISNPYLAWEETKKLQFGIELGFIQDRIQLTSTYVQNRCSNQLLNYNLPVIAGVSIPTNFPATVQNVSWEFTLNTINVMGKYFKWTTSANLTIPENKLIAFPGLETSSYNTSLVVGKPVALSILYSFLGVDQATGIFSYSDAQGNPTSDPGNNRPVFSDYEPKFYGGLSNTFEFKNFQLDLFFQFHKQVVAFSPSGDMPGRFSSGLNNQPVSVSNHWQKPGDLSPNMRYSQDYSVYLPFLYSGISDFINVDGSFIRLKNLSVSYNLPERFRKKLTMQKCRLYAHAQNLFTITNFQGLDPESVSSSVLPPLRIFTLGIQLTF